MFLLSRNTAARGRKVTLPSLRLCVYVCESRHRRNVGQGKYRMSFWPKPWSFQPVLPYLPEGFFYLFFVVWCLFRPRHLHPAKVFFFFSSSHKASGHFHALLGRCLTTKNISQLCFRMWFARVTLSNVCIRAPELAISWRTLLLNFNSGLQIVLFLVLFILG